MKRIPLTQGQFALVDDNDFEQLNKHKWYAQALTYGGFAAVRWQSNGTVSMHRQIMNAPRGLDVDHKNHNTLDNRRANLRICTRSQNLYNQLPQKNRTSRYRGVTFHGGSWEARIKKNRNAIYIGRFPLEIEAAKAYDEKAKELYAEFACLNL